MNEKERKRQLWQEIKASVRELPHSYRREADTRIAERLCGLDAYRRSNVIFVYVGTSGEIDTVPILSNALSDGKQVGVPLCVSPGVMEVRRIADFDSLIKGFYGIMEPKAECPLISPGEIDLAVVPCLSCTWEGVRLGYGGGYYDRYLNQVSGLKLVLCREKVMRENLPLEPHDIIADGVLTEHTTKFLKHSK